MGIIVKYQENNHATTNIVHIESKNLKNKIRSNYECKFITSEEESMPP